MTTRFADHILSGTHAARPAATAVPDGTIYACSDHDLIYQSDGAVWATWLSPSTVAALNDLSDVDTTGVGSGDVLTYDGADWVPQAPTGGGSSGERVKVDPTGLTWSWANQGSATITVDGEALVLYGPADAADSFRCRTIAVPSKPYSIIIHYKASQVLTNYSGVAFGWLSAGNSLTGFMHRSESGNLYWLVVKYTNLTTNSGTNYVNNVDVMEYFPWIKLSDAAGGNREIHGSATGLNDSWILLHSVATDDYLTPDRIFVAVNPRSAGWPIALTVDSVEEI